MQWVLCSAPACTHKAAVHLPAGDVQRHTPTAWLPVILSLAPFSGHEESSPCADGLPAARLCRKPGPLGSPSDCLPEAQAGARELA